MKLTFAKDVAALAASRKLPGRSAKRLSLSRARAQFGQAVGHVLADSLEALGERLLSGGLRESAHEAEKRLRDVVSSDRALRVTQQVAGSVPRAQGASLGAASEVEARPPAREQSHENRAEATVASEPIRTRTMARLLAAQGYRKRALAIYTELLSQQPGDVDLRAERDALLTP